MAFAWCILRHEFDLTELITGAGDCISFRTRGVSDSTVILQDEREGEALQGCFQIGFSFGGGVGGHIVFLYLRKIEMCVINVITSKKKLHGLCHLQGSILKNNFNWCTFYSKKSLKRNSWSIFFLIEWNV